MANFWENDPVVKPPESTAKNFWENDPVVGVDEAPDTGDTTLLGRGYETLKGIPRGFLHSFATSAEGLGQLADTATDFVGLENLIDSEDDNEVIRLARSAQDKIDNTFAADPRYRDLWTTKFGDAIGSLASFFTPALGAKVLGLAGKAGVPLTAAEKAARYIPPTLLATGMGAGESSQRIQMAREQGLEVTDKQQDIATITSAFIGLSELAPVSKILRGLKREDLFDEFGKLMPLGKTWIPRLKSALGSGSVEAIQEVSAGFAQDVLEKNLYNENLQMGQSAWDELTLGGAAGFTADLVLNAFVGRRRTGMTGQQKALEEEIGAAEEDRMGKWVKTFDPVDRTAVSGFLPDGTPIPLALPAPTAPPVDPNNPEGSVKAIASYLEDQHGDDLLNKSFTSMETAPDGTQTPTTRVVDQQGNQYGPEMSATEAGMLSHALNEKVIDRTIDTQVDMAINQSPVKYSMVDRLSLKLFGRRLFHPDNNSYTEQQINAAAGTVIENNYEHEAMSAEEAIASGVKVKDLTAAQKINRQRVKDGKPTTNSFSAAEARKALGKDFYRLSDYVSAQIGSNERFIATKIDGKPVVTSRIIKPKKKKTGKNRTVLDSGLLIYDRPRTFQEMESAPDKLERTEFKTLKDAKDYAAKLNAKAETGTILRSDVDSIGSAPDVSSSTESESWDKQIKKLLQSKNILSDINSPEIRVIAESVTGKKATKAAGTPVTDMSAGEKALLYHKLRALPGLEKPGTLPVYGLRPYNTLQYAAAKNAATALIHDQSSVFDEKSMPTREQIAKEAGQITQVGYDRLISDIKTDKGIIEATLAKQEADAQRTANEKRIAEKQKVEQGKVKKIVREMMKGFGLEKRVGTTITDVARQTKLDADGNVIEGEAEGVGRQRVASEGRYNRRMQRIFLHIESLKQKKDYQKLVKKGATQSQLDKKLAELAVSTLNHEILHAMRQLNLFTQNEWEMLETIARKRIRDNGKSYTQDAIDRYKHKRLSPVGMMEEAIAEVIRDGLSGKLKIGGPQKGLIRRVFAFLKGIVGFNSKGYTNFDDLIRAIKTGEIGRREEGVTRTLLNTERMRGVVPERGVTREVMSRAGTQRGAARAPAEGVEPITGQSQPDFVDSLAPTEAAVNLVSRAGLRPKAKRSKDAIWWVDDYIADRSPTGSQPNPKAMAYWEEVKGEIEKIATQNEKGFEFGEFSDDTAYSLAPDLSLRDQPPLVRKAIEKIGSSSLDPIDTMMPEYMKALDAGKDEKFANGTITAREFSNRLVSKLGVQGADQYLITLGIGVDPDVVDSIIHDGRQNEAFFSGKAKEASSSVIYKPVLDVDQSSTFAEAYRTFTGDGNFTGHISKMIAGFAEKQMMVSKAITNGLKPKSFLDIGASEGGLAKTIAAHLSASRVVAVDPNPDMLANFNQTPDVRNVEYLMQAFMSDGWVNDDGTEIVRFKPDQKFDVINEDFTFQFINNDRASQVAEVKSMLSEGGVFITSEKFHTKNSEHNERKKLDHQRKYFSGDEITQDKQEIIVGMSDDMVSDADYQKILNDQFKFVKEFWNAGDFKGYIASDSAVKVNRALREVGDLSSEFSDPDVADSVSRDLPMDHASRMKRAKQMGFDPDQIWYHGTKELFRKFRAVHPDGLMFFTLDPKMASSWIERPRKGFLGFSNEYRNDPWTAYDQAMEDEYKKTRPQFADKEFDDWTQEEMDQFSAWMFAPDKPPTKNENEVMSDNLIYPVLLRKGTVFDPRKDWKKIEPLLLSGKMPGTGWDQIVAKGHHKNGNWIVYENKEVVDWLKENGYDSMLLRESAIEGEPHDTLAVFDPTAIRSVNAAFDPKKAGSEDIMDTLTRSGTGQTIIPRVPDRSSAEAKYLTPIGDVEEAMIKLFDRTGGNPSRGQLARLPGAPIPRFLEQEEGKRRVRDPRDVNVRPSTIDEIRDMLREGLETEQYREWYKQFGNGIREIVGEANMGEASVLFGITSAQNSVEQNLADTLTIMRIAREIDPVEKPFDFKHAVRTTKRPNGQKLFVSEAQVDKMIDMYQTGIPEAGFKTSTLMQNVQDSALNRFNPFTVQDVHMARAVGWLRRKKKKGKWVDAAIIPDIKPYRYAQFITSYLAHEFGVTPQEAQAAIWFVAKNRLGGKAGKPGTWKSAYSFTKPERSLITQMIADNKFSRSTALTPALQGDQIKASNRIYAKKIVPYSNFHQDDAIQKLASDTAPIAAVSAKPGNARGYGLPEQTPYMAVSAHNRATAQAIMDKDDQIPFIREMGVPHKVILSEGTFGSLEPNILVKLLGGTDAQTEYIASILGDALLQDVAITVRPRYDIGEYIGLMVRKGDKSAFTEAEMRLINEAVNPNKDIYGYNFTKLKENGLVFIDGRQYDDTVTYDTVTMYPAFVNNLMSSMPAGLDLVSEQFHQDGKLIENEDYQATARRIGPQIRRPFTPDLLRRIDDTLYRPAWEQYQKTVRNLGITPENTTRPEFKYRDDTYEDYDTVYAARPSESTGRSRRRSDERRRTTPQETNELILSGSRAEGASSFRGVHYGNTEKLPVLTADRFGTGIKGAERVRVMGSSDPRIKRRVYFYIKRGQTTRPEPGLGQHVYVQDFGNILDVTTPAFDRVHELEMQHPDYGWDDQTAFEASVIDAGFDGYASPQMGMMVVLDHDVPVDYLGTMQELEKAGTPARYDRESVLEHDPVAVQEVVDRNLAAEEKPGLGIPKYSIHASPEAQYIAQNPDRANRDGEFDIADAMREPQRPASYGAAVDKASTGAPAQRHPMSVYNNATGALSTPSRFTYTMTKFKQEAINRYARLEHLNWSTDLRENLGDASSIAAAFHAERAMGISGAAIKYGIPVYHNGWLHVLNEDLATELDIDIPGLDLTRIKSLIDVNAPLFSKEYGDLTRDAQAYAITRRSYRLDNEGIEVPVTQAERNEIEAGIQQYVDPDTGENIIKRWYEDWQFYNDNVIKMMQGAGVLTDETADLWRNMADYFPFYRIAEGSGADQFRQGQPVFGGMTGAIQIKRMKGSEESVNMDMLEAMALNLSAAIQMSMKNIAQQRIVRDMIQLGLAEMRTGVGSTNGHVVAFRVAGKQREAIIYDPLIYESMMPLDGTELVSTIRNTFGKPATWLRELVTRDPGFMLVNLLRDSLSSYATSGASLIPLASTFKGLFDGVERLEMMGVVGGYDYSNDPDDMVKFWNTQLRKAGINRGGGMSALNMFTRIWDGLGEGTTASDAATRNAVFDDVYAKTGNYAEASLQAMEVINFGRRGRHPLARILGAIVPFLNARFQGLDVFWRAYTGQYTANKERNRSQIIASALARGTLLTSATIAYYLLVSDDDQYKNAPDFSKDNNWLIPTPWGVPISIPIPFEVGLLFKTVPETIMGLAMSGKDGRDVRSGREARDTLVRGVGSTLEISPFAIQFAGPIMEAVTNYNSFTGRQVVPQYLMDTMEAGAQSEVYTNEAAKWLGKQMNISPMKLQHVAEGYAGTMGAYLFDLIDIGLKSETIQGDRKSVMPQRPYWDYPIIKRFFGKLNDKGLVQDTYDIYREVNKVYATFNDMRKNGREQEAMAYLKKRQTLLGLRGGMASVKRQLDIIRKQREFILRSNMSAKTKRQQIDALDAAQNNLLKHIVPTFEKMADLPFHTPMFYD
jgi:SAM-dependent methyltransferase